MGLASTIEVTNSPEQVKRHLKVIIRKGLYRYARDSAAIHIYSTPELIGISDMVASVIMMDDKLDISLKEGR